MDRLIDSVLAIEDCLILSSPELMITNAIGKHKIWKWAISKGVHGFNGMNLVKAWKSFTSHVKSLACKSKEPLPKLESSLPFQRKGNLDPELLRKAGLDWLAHVIVHGVTSKSLGTRTMHLVSTRGMPPPTLKMIREGLNEHGSIIAGPRQFTISEERKSILYKLGKRLGRYARSRQRCTDSAAHLSLSNSASLEGPRKSGGRAQSVGFKYASWANEICSKSEKGTTIFGLPYWTVEGKRRFHTMCRHAETLGNLIESDNQFEIDIGPDYRFEDRIYGLDQFTGYQILQFAFEEGIKSGVIEGPIYIPEGQYVPVHTLKRIPRVRASPIGEPGGKVRTVTVAEDWLTIFLSPFAHELGSYVKLIPAGQAGMSAAAQAYEWCKRTGRMKDLDKVEDLHFLTSDLTQASEYLEFEYTRALLGGFIQGCGIWSPYMDLALRVLTYPRELTGPPYYEWDGELTARGSLMGDPGTKSALMLTMLASEEEAFLRQVSRETGRSFEEVLNSPDPTRPWRCFSAAGDDHLAIGPLDYLRGIKETLVKNGGMISQEKAFISTVCAYFTEELVIKLPETRFYSEKPLWDRPYEETPHVDAMKVRLLSPCSKLTEVREEKNPAFGKSSHFMKKVSWMQGEWKTIEPLAIARFYTRFDKYIDRSSPFLYAPNYLGGLGFPPHPSDDFEWIDHLEKLDPIVIQSMVQVIQSRAPPLVENALKSFGTRTAFRGMNARTLAEEQTKAVFQFFLDDSRPEELLMESLEKTPEDWRKMSRRDKRELARRSGYIEFSEALQMFERPTYFKEILAGLPNAYRKDDIFKTYELREKMVKKMLLKTRLTLSELGKHFPEIADSYKKSRTNWFARQMWYETRAFSLLPHSSDDFGIGGQVLNEDFATRTFSRREKDLVCDLLLLTESREEIGPLRKVLYNQLIGGVVPPPPTGLYIRRSRIAETLCTLQTPLTPLSGWEKKHKPNQAD
jgi:hypothetical protein